VIHLYGVVDGLAELPQVAGLGDAPLERRRVDGLELVLSQAPPTAEVTREALLRHAEVVDALSARCAAILPAQLGHAFRDDAELADAVRAQAPQLARGLERVRGCVEFGLRAIPPVQESEIEAGSGVEYLFTSSGTVFGGTLLIALLNALVLYLLLRTEGAREFFRARPSG